MQGSQFKSQDDTTMATMPSQMAAVRAVDQEGTHDSGLEVQVWASIAGAQRVDVGASCWELRLLRLLDARGSHLFTYFIARRLPCLRLNCVGS